MESMPRMGNAGVTSVRKPRRDEGRAGRVVRSRAAQRGGTRVTTRAYGAQRSPIHIRALKRGGVSACRVWAGPA